MVGSETPTLTPQAHPAPRYLGGLGTNTVVVLNWLDELERLVPSQPAE